MGEAEDAPNDFCGREPDGVLKQPGHVSPPLSFQTRRACLAFDPARVSPAALIGRVAERHAIRDLFVQNPPIEELIARLYRDRRMMPQAVEWLERASQAPAPNESDGHQLLYELADALEKAGESARALAILLELQSEAGSYRDGDERIDRLTKVQARG